MASRATKRKGEMPLIRKATESQFETIQAGTYEVTCVEVKPERWEEDVYGNFDKLRFTLEVQDMVDDEENPARLSGLCNDILSEKSTLWSWLYAFGLSPSYDAEIDVEMCVGKRAMAQVSVKESKKDETPYNKIEAMFRLPAGGQRGATVPLQVIGEDGSVKWIAFWKSMENVGVSRQNVADSLGVDMDGLTKHLASLTPDEVIDLLASSGATV